MKSLFYSVVVFVLLVVPGSVFSQSDQNETHYYGSSYDIILGFHSGIYDCNQDFEFPVNLGLFGQYHYRPEILENLFFGFEAGAFFAQGAEKEWDKDNGIYLAYASLYPGVSINLSRKKLSKKAQAKANLYSRKLKLAAGVTYGRPFGVTGYRIDTKVKNAFNGFGFTAMINWDVGSRTSLIGSVSRINSDTDGRGFTEDGERVPANLVDRTFWYRVGFTYNLIGD